MTEIGTLTVKTCVDARFGGGRMTKEMPLTSALFQASIYLECAYPEDSVERLIADTCAQAASELDAATRMASSGHKLKINP